MENQLMVKEVNFLSNGQEVRLTGNIVKNYLTKGNGKISDQETAMFINLCKYQELNPFLNEAYLVKFGEAPAQIVTSKEAYMKRSEKHTQYDGMKAGIIIQRGEEIIETEGSFTLKNDILLGGWCEIYRKDRKYPFKSKVSLDEYNKGQSTWKNMPKTMIRKTAIVQALREAFPCNLGGLYTEEEQIAPSVEDGIKENANSEIIDIVPDKKNKEDIVEDQKVEDEAGF